MSSLNLFSRAGNEGDCLTSILQPGPWCLGRGHAKVQPPGVLRKSRPKGRNSPGLKLAFFASFARDLEFGF